LALKAFLELPIKSLKSDKGLSYTYTRLAFLFSRGVSAPVFVLVFTGKKKSIASVQSGNARKDKIQFVPLDSDPMNARHTIEVMSR
jgi:hypothetical protein